MLLSYLAFRSRRLRPILDGEPTVLVEDGKPIEGNLRRQRLTREEIGAEARLNQISSIEDCVNLTWRRSPDPAFG